MNENSDFLREKELLLKNRLEVKLNDLEKKHLESKEREAQTVGFLERRLKQVELEHKTELKLRRQLRYEVNNLRKRLLETYKLYTDTLEQNEKMRAEIDNLKSQLLLNDKKLNICRELEIQILDFNYRNTNIENRNVLQDKKISFESKNNFDVNKEKLLNSVDRNKNFDSLTIFNNEKSTLNIRYNKNKKLRENQVVKPILEKETKKNLITISERADEWLNQMEELYKPIEYSEIHSRKLNDEINFYSNIRTRSSLENINDILIDENYFSDDNCMTENTEKVITDTGFIIDQISQQDKELSDLLKKTSISNNKYINLNRSIKDKNKL